MTARRIVVVGVSGSGKTTLARRLGAYLGIPHADMDGFFHGPGLPVVRLRSHTEAEAWLASLR